MKKKRLLVIAFSILFISYFAWAKFTTSSGDQKVNYIPSLKKCFDGQGSVSWKYCIHTPAQGGTNGNVAYLLHGRNLDEQTWNDDTFYTAMIQQYWQKNKITPPTVVTVSFGPIWLLTEKGQKEKSGLLNFFTTNVLKEVESKTGAPKSRIVFGESMGGLNSLVLGFKAGQLFQKVASSCPAVYAMSPFSPIGEVQDFLKRTGADPKIVYGVIQLAKEFIKDQKEWDNFSPLQTINAANAKNSPEIYLSCGLYDTYGNYEGNELLAQKAASLGFKLTWHPIYGGHCATDVVSLAEFLSK